LRVFISYAHEDKAQVKKIAEALTVAGAMPLWDAGLKPGLGFTPQIRSMIVHSHLFLSLRTARTQHGPWPYQELGFALAHRLPVLPVTNGPMPAGIVAGTHALVLRKNFSDASSQITDVLLGDLVEAGRTEPALFECTEDNERRAALLAAYASAVLQLGHHGCVRQKASLSSFHLPDRHEEDPLWRRYFSTSSTEGTRLFASLRDERVALCRHARVAGARLILDAPSNLRAVYRRHGTESVRERIQSMVEFLSGTDAKYVQVAICEKKERRESLTIVGDWFSSEAVSSALRRIVREAVFTRHAPTLCRQVADFDQEFEDSLNRRGWSARESRVRAIQELRAYLATLDRDPRTRNKALDPVKISPARRR